jgi:nucleoside diphosphate kinase
LRALFGKNIHENMIHASDSVERGIHEVNVFFPLTLERSMSVIADPRLGTASNPYPKDHRASAVEIHARLERTLSIIKPDAYSAGKKDAILQMIIADGFKIVKEAEMQLTLAQVQDLYIEHQNKPFYDQLVNWISGYLYE